MGGGRRPLSDLNRVCLPLSDCGFILTEVGGVLQGEGETSQVHHPLDRK